jgi:hypothetical protein
MKKKASFWVACVMSLPALLVFAPWARAETRIVDSYISNDPIWNAEGSPYLLSTDIMVPYGHSLTVEPGTVVRADPVLGWKPSIYVYGDIYIGGIGSTTILDDSLWGLTVDHGHTTISNVHISMPYGTSLVGATAEISSSTLSGAVRAVHSIESRLDVRGSRIVGNDIGIMSVPVEEDIFPVKSGDISGGIGGSGISVSTYASKKPISSTIDFNPILK